MILRVEINVGKPDGGSSFSTRTRVFAEDNSQGLRISFGGGSGPEGSMAVATVENDLAQVTFFAEAAQPLFAVRDALLSPPGAPRDAGLKLAETMLVQALIADTGILALARKARVTGYLAGVADGKREKSEEIAKALSPY